MAVSQATVPRVAIAGASGKMGQLLVAEVHASTALALAALVSRTDLPPLTFDVATVQCVNTLAEVVQTIDLVIDFTRPENTSALLPLCQQHGVAMVIGTTGLEEAQLDTIEKTACDIPLLLAPNTSLGVALLSHLVQIAGQALKKQQVDIEIVEAHHNQKVDAPSGTALALGRAVADGIGYDLSACARTDRAHRNEPRQAGEIGFSAVRAGAIVGDHDVIFGFGDEVLSFSHRALNRRLFAQGAVFAATWLAQQPAGKLYTMQDALALGV